MCMDVLCVCVAMGCCWPGDRCSVDVVGVEVLGGCHRTLLATLFCSSLLLELAARCLQYCPIFLLSPLNHPSSQLLERNQRVGHEHLIVEREHIRGGFTHSVSASHSTAPIVVRATVVVGGH